MKLLRYILIFRELKAFRNILGSEVANKFAIIGEKNKGNILIKVISQSFGKQNLIAILQVQKAKL